jgi:hypothetical protein
MAMARGSPFPSNYIKNTNRNSFVSNFIIVVTHSLNAAYVAKNPNRSVNFAYRIVIR